MKPSFKGLFCFPKYYREFNVLQRCLGGFHDALFLILRACLAPAPHLRPKSADLALKTLHLENSLREESKHELGGIVKLHMTTFRPLFVKEC